MVNIFFIILFVVLSILFGKMINIDTPEVPKLLAQTAGAIEKDNFSYFYINSHGPIILNLTSLIGDADLYISDSNMYPTYHPESYTLHSATCGEDIIVVPESFESPIAVGVFGHAESSFYSLEIYENPNAPSPYKQWVSIHNEVESLKGVNKQGSNIDINTNNDKKRSNSNPSLKKKKSKSNSNISSIFSVLEILQLIFL